MPNLLVSLLKASLVFLLLSHFQLDTCIPIAHLVAGALEYSQRLVQEWLIQILYHAHTGD